MPVKVFNLVPGVSHLAYRPQDMFNVHGWEGGLDIQPQIGRLGYDQLEGMAIFTRLETGGTKLFLMLMTRGRARPILADSAKIHFNDFRLPGALSAVEMMRRLGRHICHRAGDVIVDQRTLDFLEGQPPPLFEKEVLQLTTAFGQLLMPEAAESPAPPIDEPEPGDIYEGDMYEGDVSEGDVYEGDGGSQGDSIPPVNPYAKPNAERTRGDVPSVSLLTPLTYPLRGLALWAWIPLTILLPFGLGCFWIVVAPVMAGFFFEIIRQTAQGRDSLKGYPDFNDMVPRFVEVIVTYVVGLIPMGISSGVTSLLPSVYEDGGIVVGILVTLVILAVDLLCFSLWVIALGSTAVYQDWSFSIRVDLHVRALVKCWKAVQVFMLRVFMLLCLVFLVFLVFLATDQARILLTSFLISPVYIFLASAHFIGLIFRENEAEMGSIYLPK